MQRRIILLVGGVLAVAFLTGLALSLQEAMREAEFKDERNPGLVR